MRRRQLLSLVLAWLLSVGATAANAQLIVLPTTPGVWYFGGEGGWTSLENQQNNVPGIVFPQSWKDGFAAGARAGLEWGSWRFESEFRYQQNNTDRLVLHPSTGGRTAYALMANVLYDLDLGWPVSPHLGGGIGAVDLHENTSVPILGLGPVFPGSDWVFGYQAIAGLRYNISPALAFDLDYRYLATTDAHFTTPPGLIVDGVARGNLTVTSGYEAQSIVASLSLRFGAPPPPVVAPPAPPEPPPVMRKVFLVFFDWDRDTITPEGMQIIQQAANAFHGGAPVTIQVTGYTDRSGSPGYNQRLSERRANNVANALVRLGVPRAQMAVSGRGENDNRVPTADGVREPQNRRVEIVFP
jgi:outer membrane protein OmpA-like peptidoglycan-associated protein